MTFVAVTNVLLVLLCIGVLVQSARLMRSVRQVRSDDLGDTVRHFDRATDQARDVLADLKRVLTVEGLASARAIETAQTLRDELSVMVGIGNAVAERIMEAAEASKIQEAKPVAARSVTKRARGSRGRGGKGVAAKTAETATEAKDTALVGPVLPSASITLLPNLKAA